MEGGGNHRRESNGRSYPSASINPAEDKCIEFHGIPEGEECADDIRSACEPEVQVREPALLGERVLCEHSGAE